MSLEHGTNVQIITACDLGPNGTIYANFKLIIIIVISSMADTDDDDNVNTSRENREDNVISQELLRCINDTIWILCQSGSCETDDSVQFRLDWLYNVVRFEEQIASGERIANLLNRTRNLFQQHFDSQNRPVFYNVETVLNGQPGRPRFSITKEQIGYFLDLHFNSVEIA